MIYIGMDDTDTLQSRGTGALARNVAAELAREYQVIGVIRHQLLHDPRVPCTKNNSSKGLLLADGEGRDGTAVDLAAVAARIRELMLADFIPGSDPGLCVTRTVPDEVVAFGHRVQQELVTQKEARDLAARHDLKDAVAQDFAVQFTSDRDGACGHLGLDSRSLGDRQCSFALNLAFREPFDPQVLLGFVQAVEMRVLVDAAFA